MNICQYFVCSFLTSLIQWSTAMLDMIAYNIQCLYYVTTLCNFLMHDYIRIVVFLYISFYASLNSFDLLDYKNLSYLVESFHAFSQSCTDTNNHWKYIYVNSVFNKCSMCLHFTILQH